MTDGYCQDCQLGYILTNGHCCKTGFYNGKECVEVDTVNEIN